VPIQFELFPNLPTVLDPVKRRARYLAYLKSDRWKKITEKTFKLANYQCQYFGPTCQGSINLECHHRHYNNLYRERPGIDTECVCRNCHDHIHTPKADNDNVPLADRKLQRP
jgi:5-methylcytosine-specific restriction endonuclease McrA